MRFFVTDQGRQAAQATGYSLQSHKAARGGPPTGTGSTWQR